QAQSERGLADRLGFKPGQVVQEFGYDDDVDERLRESIAELTGEELVDEDDDGIFDAALLWWRSDDEGDLTDALVDVLGSVEGGGICHAAVLWGGGDEEGDLTGARVDVLG